MTDWTVGALQPVSVTQPPARSAPGFGASQKLRRTARKRLKGLHREIQQFRNAGRANPKQHRTERAFVRRVARHKRTINAPALRARKAHLANLRAKLSGHKATIAKTKKEMLSTRRRLKQSATAHSAQGQKRATMRAYHQAKKAASWMWILHQAKKALQRGTRARKPDGRNHGFTGVRGRSGLTGLAGR